MSIQAVLSRQIPYGQALPANNAAVVRLSPSAAQSASASQQSGLLSSISAPLETHRPAVASSPRSMATLKSESQVPGLSGLLSSASVSLETHRPAATFSPRSMATLSSESQVTNDMLSKRSTAPVQSAEGLESKSTNFDAASVVSSSFDQSATTDGKARSSAGLTLEDRITKLEASVDAKLLKATRDATHASVTLAKAVEERLEEKIGEMRKELWQALQSAISQESNSRKFEQGRDIGETVRQRGVCQLDAASVPAEDLRALQEAAEARFREVQAAVRERRTAGESARINCEELDSTKFDLAAQGKPLGAGLACTSKSEDPGQLSGLVGVIAERVERVKDQLAQNVVRDPGNMGGLAVSPQLQMEVAEAMRRQSSQVPKEPENLKQLSLDPRENTLSLCGSETTLTIEGPQKTPEGTLKVSSTKGFPTQSAFKPRRGLQEDDQDARRFGKVSSETERQTVPLRTSSVPAIIGSRQDARRHSSLDSSTRTKETWV